MLTADQRRDIETLADALAKSEQTDAAWRMYERHLKENPAPLYDGAGGRATGIHHWSCTCRRCKP